ncbi:MAG: beta-N-acetylhexosaminidase [Clostridia bacterium]|nr:beta-N-acetylhexosaminidase [Clostridia bacterium]
MKKFYKRLGVMIDMSRNSVMSVPALKKYLQLLKKIGYNSVMLYTEDTYEVEGEPFFGYMRGRYSIAEMKEIDAFASSIGIEMIPCIQTLAHLNASFRWGKIPVDTGDIMLADNERTYELIDRMFKTLSDCFASRYIHIGMDEAQMLGRGRHLDEHGYEPSIAIIKRHLARIEEIAKKYGYTCLLWSDMFFRSWNNHAYYCDACEMPKEVVESVPKGVIPVYWDYYHSEEKIYDDMFYNHAQLAKEVWFAGGAWCWKGFVPDHVLSLQTMEPALRSCRSHKVKNIYFTLWGDDGGETSHFAQLATLLYLAEYAKGNEDLDSIKAKCKRILGVDYDDMVAMGDIDQGFKMGKNAYVVNPSKHMLYSDYFNDFLDCSVDPEKTAHFADCAKRLHAAAKKSRRYGYLFDSLAKLCDVHAIKYDLGLRTRRAYEAKDMDALRRLAEYDYKEVERRLRIFHAALQKQWFTENKPCGFDIQDLRLGGIIQRTISCRARILDYVNGKLDSIQELDEPLLSWPSADSDGVARYVNSYPYNASPNVFGH